MEDEEPVSDAALAAIQKSFLAGSSPAGRAADPGRVLSLWQPYAGLMCAGVKRVEGRVWSSDYTGWLWIHAGSKKLDKDEFDAVLDSYAPQRDQFPDSFPTSAILGRVYVIAQLSHADYERCTDICHLESNQSPFVFLTSQWQQLLVPIRASGDHKIWTMPKPLYKSCKLAIDAL